MSHGTNWDNQNDTTFAPDPVSGAHLRCWFCLFFNSPSAKNKRKLFPFAVCVNFVCNKNSGKSQNILHSLSSCRCRCLFIYLLFCVKDQATSRLPIRSIACIRECVCVASHLFLFELVFVSGASKSIAYKSLHGKQRAAAHDLENIDIQIKYNGNGVISAAHTHIRFEKRNHVFHARTIVVDAIYPEATAVMFRLAANLFGER